MMFSEVMIGNAGDVFFTFLRLSTHISLGLHSFGTAEASSRWGGKLNIHLLTSCVRKIHTKNY